MKRIKCKNCKKLLEGICSHFKRRRSSGKKRECNWFDARPPKQKVYAPYVRFKTRQERRKDKEAQIEERKRQEEMKKKLDQRKLVAVAVAKPSIMPDKVCVKKPSIFKRIFRRTAGK